MSTNEFELTIKDGMNTNVVRKYGRDRYTDNPFIDNFSVTVKKRTLTVAKGLQITDQEQKDVSAGTVGMYKLVDTEEFVKVYTQNIRFFFDLSHTAQNVLMPLMLEIQKSAKDVAHIYFSYDDAIENCKILEIKHMSRVTFNRGINELIKSDFIAPAAKGNNWWWLNPNLVFNGDRIKFVKEYKLIRDEEHRLAREKEMDEFEAQQKKYGLKVTRQEVGKQLSLLAPFIGDLPSKAT